MQKWFGKNGLTIRFSMVYVLFFAGYCAINGFPMVFLTDKGFRNFFSRSFLAISFTQTFQITEYGLFMIVSVYYANQQVEESDRVLSQELIYGVISVRNMIANLVSGPLLESFGVRG